ncbi:MAG: hypothetical protein ACE5KT_11435 [Methanosarcinales archaeon]
MFVRNLTNEEKIELNNWSQGVNNLIVRPRIYAKRNCKIDENG